SSSLAKLTEHYYSVRFGHRPLSAQADREARELLADLSHHLAARSRRTRAPGPTEVR
ncbi:MAG: DUF4129 domain-containing protein, partial [Phycisphaerales bacterium]|nr:DUF4129 domain-containing protein [Phycisphaerales bacterium]